MRYFKKRLYILIIRTRKGVQNLRIWGQNINFAPVFGDYSLENGYEILKIVHFAKLTLQNE